MAKPGVNFEEVVTAAQDLEKQGEKLTVERIKEALGGRGSLAAINRFLKEWKGQPGETQAGANQTFDLIGENMQQTSQHTSSETEGNVSASSLQHSNGPVTSDMQDQQQPTAASELTQVESNSTNSAPATRHAMPPKSAPQAKMPSPFDETREAYQPERLEGLDDNALVIKIRRLETLLAKEASRREAAEKMAEEAKEYADIIKEQIGQRVADIKQTMEVTINQVKAEARELKQNADSDLKFYREQLQKANVKIVSLLTGQASESTSTAEPVASKDPMGSISE